MIPSRIHGMLDYLVAVFLIACPWIFGFADNTAAQWVPVILGIITIFYSLVTNYEWGALRSLPYSGHLLLDTLNGAILAGSPWIFGFAERIYLPHLVLGLMELMVVALSQKKAFPAGEKRRVA